MSEHEGCDRNRETKRNRYMGRQVRKDATSSLDTIISSTDIQDSLQGKSDSRNYFLLSSKTINVQDSKCYKFMTQSPTVSFGVSACLQNQNYVATDYLKY